MLRYILKRLLLMIPVLLGISFILFSILNLTPGDPARAMLGEGATEEDVQQLREEMGLNDPFFVRYGKYIIDLFQGDFGKSYVSGRLVSDEILTRFPTTIRLAFCGITFAVLVGIPVGIISAVRQYTIIDNVSLIATLILTSMPGFWLGLMLILTFSLKLGWLPTAGSDTWMHMILPTITVSAASLATLIRMTRSTMLETIRQDYIRTAKSKGATGGCVIFKHALRNALIPVVTVVGIQFGTLLGGAVITESVFAINGLGYYIVEAVKMKDAPVVIGAVMLIAFVGGLVNLIVDVLYTYIDPRLKAQFAKG